MDIVLSVNKLITYLGLFIEYIGLFIVVIASLAAFIKIFVKKFDVEIIRIYFAENVIFGLEFVIAADVLLATVATDLNDILQLGGIVLVRVILGYSLRKDVAPHHHAAKMKKKVKLMK